jgi:Tol biopolymer transport system component
VIDEAYFYDPTTGHISRVTTNNVAEIFPVFSPDGRYLSYITDTGSISVCPLSFAAGNWSCGPVRGVVSDPSPGNGGRYVWTPDGRSIVYGAQTPSAVTSTSSPSS